MKNIEMKTNRTAKWLMRDEDKSKRAQYAVTQRL